MNIELLRFIHEARISGLWHFRGVSSYDEFMWQNCLFFSVRRIDFLARVATKLTGLDISAGVVILTGNSYLNLKINKIKF